MFRVARKRGFVMPMTMTSTTKAKMMALSWLAIRVRSWKSRSAAGRGRAICAIITTPKAKSPQKAGPMALK